MQSTLLIHKIIVLILKLYSCQQKREAPQTNVQKAVKNVVNPYSLQRDTRKQAAPRMQQRRGGMNADLLKCTIKAKEMG